MRQRPAATVPAELDVHTFALPIQGPRDRGRPGQDYLPLHASSQMYVAR